MNDPNQNHHFAGEDDNDDQSSKNDFDDAGLPRRGQPQRRGGLWEGEALEWERSKEHSDAKDQTTTAAYVAVDLNQFRNQEVGRGYQAKHVIRQKAHYVIEPPSSNSRIVDMTTKKDTTDSNSSQRSKKRKNATNDSTTTTKKVSRLDRYLQCAGMRQFRKELESIVSSP
jgi:hypothetical protein